MLERLKHRLIAWDRVCSGWFPNVDTRDAGLGVIHSVEQKPAGTATLVRANFKDFHGLPLSNQRQEFLIPVLFVGLELVIGELIHISRRCLPGDIPNVEGLKMFLAILGKPSTHLL